MSKYTFSKKNQVKHSNLSVAEGVHVAVVVQVLMIALMEPSMIGLMAPFFSAD